MINIFGGADVLISSAFLYENLVFITSILVGKHLYRRIHFFISDDGYFLVTFT